VGDDASFAAAVAAGALLAADDRIVTFGVKPSEAHTGYGYITAGAPLGGGFEVAKFVEKPQMDAARALVESGASFWNSGIYMFRARFYLDELGRLAPEVREAVQHAWREGATARSVRTLGADAWAKCPSDSIDYAVAEKTDRCAMIPVDMAWSDVGSWGALHEIGDGADGGNVVSGDVVIVDSGGNYVRAESRLVALVGVHDLVVVETADAIVVLPRSRAQDVKSIVEMLKKRGRNELL
jgi:mannose-1-phosphate guanylyltransferase/mannose-6-phosphate isomerase